LSRIVLFNKVSDEHLTSRCLQTRVFMVKVQVT